MKQRKSNDLIILEMLKQGKQQRDIAKHFEVSEAAISQRLKRLAPRPASVQRLTPKEQSFAMAVAHGKTQTAAAIDAFDVTTRDSAKTIGARLMKDAEVVTAIKDILQQEGATPEWVAKRFKHWGDSPDPQASLRATENVAKLHDMYPANKNLNINAVTTFTKVDLMLVRIALDEKINDE